MEGSSYNKLIIFQFYLLPSLVERLGVGPFFFYSITTRVQPWMSGSVPYWMPRSLL